MRRAPFSALMLAALPLLLFLAFALWWSFSDWPVILWITLMTFPITLAIVCVVLTCLVAALWFAAWRLARLQRSKVLVTMLLSVLLVWPIWLSKDYLRLAISAPFYLPKILAAQGRPVAFPWKQTGWGGIGNSQQFLIYDPHGRMKAMLGRRRNVDTEPFLGPFYLSIVSED